MVTFKGLNMCVKNGYHSVIFNSWRCTIINQLKVHTNNKDLLEDEELLEIISSIGKIDYTILEQ